MINRPILSCLFILFPLTALFAQDNLTLGAEVAFEDHGSYDFLIPADIDTLLYPLIRFSTRGADGGRAKYNLSFSSNPKIAGGEGASVNVDFTIGQGANKLRPGGTIRFIVGEKGANCFTGNQCGGGGGGGTAILYLDPGAIIPTDRDTASLGFSTNGQSNCSDHWILLAVAAGGGGGVVNQIDQLSNYISSRGGQGSNIREGRPSGDNDENAGGIYGGDGDDSERSTGGKGYRSAGWEAMPNDETYETIGGSGYGSGGSARPSGAVAGGGGGFSGGGAGENTLGGGGGGSFVNLGGFNRDISVNGFTRFPKDGTISYQVVLDDTPGNAPTANCVENFTVTLTGGEATTITPADFDNGSSDPANLDLTYQMCQTIDGTEYFCRDNRTWACNEVGDTEPWFLAVSNGYQTSYCAVSLIVAEKQPTPVCPLSGITVYNLNGTCTQPLTAAELAHQNVLDCANSFPDVRLILPDNSNVTNPAGFFTDGYTFADGTTTLVYETEGGSCAFAIDVRADAASQLPLTCPATQTIDIGTGNCETTVSAASLALNYDGPGTISYRLEPGTAEPASEGNGQFPDYTFGRGRNIITYTVSEAGGCQRICSFNVRVDYTADNAIDFACQDVDFPFTNGFDFREAYLAGLVRATDDCGEAPVRLGLGFLTGCSAAGTTQEVRLTVGNGAFEQTCSYQLTLTAPDFTPTCSAQFLRINLDESGNQEITPEMLASWTASDDISASVNVNSVDCNNVGTAINVTVTLEDECGNSDSCIRQIRVGERIRPSITCQNITRALDGNGEAFITYSDIVTSVEDNCGAENLTFTLDQSVFTCSDRGNTTIFVRAEDASDNAGLCSATVTITDDTPPTITCKDATIELGADGTYSLGVDDVVAAFSDNCSGGFSFSKGNFTCDDLANSPISINVRYRDVGNNTTVCNSVITIAQPECPCLAADGILVVDDPEDVILCEDLTVEGVRFVEGNLFLNGFTLTVAPTGQIQNEGESAFTNGGAGGKLLTSGIAEFQNELMTEIGLTLSNLSDDIRLERLERSGRAVEIDGFPSITRVITVEESFSPPSSNARFHYLDAELNGNVESELGLYLEQNGVWAFVPALSHNTTDNYFEFALDFEQLANPVRFTLANAAALPLDLLAFTGRTEGKVNVLNWTTVDEEGFSHFAVERSVNGAQWVHQGAVAGAGEVEGAREYRYVDDNPPALAYYRLRIVDLDGSSGFSPLVRLEREAKQGLNIYPNPNDGRFTVGLPQVEGPLDLALYTVHGTRVRAQKTVNEQRTWSATESLTPGIYLLVVEGASGRWTRRIVVR